MYIIRKATKDDVDQILRIYNNSILFLRNLGVDQWQNNYPNIDVVNNDINNDCLYVLTDDKNIIGVMAFIKDKDYTYDKIYNGNWISNGIYYTIHRISVLNKGKNIAKYLIDYAIKESIRDNVLSLRIDTHSDNFVMQKFLEKCNFKYCGEIYLKDGSLRRGYEYMINSNFNKYTNELFSSERTLYNKKEIIVDNSAFKGEEDGESALKECENVLVYNTLFDLRYPLWHSTNIDLNNINMTINCRAPIWYSKNINISDSVLKCVKGLRECSNTNIVNSSIESLEFGWKSNNINVSKSELKGEYMFLDSSVIKLDSVKFNGKYSFQYVCDLEINNCEINTKDAFWHANNVIVRDSYIKGEYLGWYSKNVKFVNCIIESTQALCYCESLVLENCKLVNSDLSFEYSDVTADIESINSSIKNPLKGSIICDKNIDIIMENSKYDSQCVIKIKD